MGNFSSQKSKSDEKHTETARVVKASSEFPVYKSKDIPFEWKSPKDVIDEDAVFYGDGTTAFQQGELGNCWLMTAIESLRQECNKDFLDKVVRVSDDGLEFRFWQIGKDEHTVRLENDLVPTREGSLLFVHNAGGNEYWGILLEKAYAKWVGSYEGLEGGFWVDGIQSFTGGVTERIKLSQVPEDFFDIMLHAYQGGSSLACIKKNCDSQAPEKYHSCCINIVKIEEDTRKIWVQDSNTQERSEWEYENFIQKFHRLDMCHRDLDKLSSLQNRQIGSGSWDRFRLEALQWNDNNTDEYSITLTDPDDDDEQKCTFILEVVQKIKPDEETEQKHIKPWDALVQLWLNVGEETVLCKFPQETHCFTLEPGSHDIKFTVETSEHCEIFMRIYSKKDFDIERKN